jgi:peptide/nickel transport system substrate-binding protein
LMKKRILSMALLCLPGLTLAGTQDYVNCHVILKGPDVAYFDAGSSDGVVPGESFEIFYDQMLVVSGTIEWSDENISRSSPMDSTLYLTYYSIEDLVARINLYVPQANRGGFLSLPSFADLRLSPGEIDTPDDMMVGRLIHRGLLGRDKNGDIVPDLAGVYEVRGMTYTFYIRPEARFHSGKAVEVTDVAFSLEQLARQPRLTAASCFVLEIKGAREYRAGIKNEISGVFLIDAKTLSITLEEPFPAFADYLAGPGAYIVPRISSELPGGNVIGAGAYKIKWWDADGVGLERVSSDPESAFLDSLIFLKFNDVDEAGLALELGRLDILPALGVPAPSFVSRKTYTSITSKTNCTAVLGVNSRRGFQKRGGLSRALSYMLDRESIIRAIIGGTAQIPEIAIPDYGTVEFGLNSESGIDSVEYYLNRVKELPEVINLYVDTRYPPLKNVARYISGQMRNRGIQVREKIGDLSIIDPQRAESDIDLYLTYSVPVSTDPDCVFFPLFSIDLAGESNFLYFEEEAFGKFLSRLRTETDDYRRRGIAFGLARSLVEESPAVMLYQPHLLTILAADVSGLKPLEAGYLDLRWAFIE